MKPYPLAALLFLLLFIGYPLRAVTYPDTLSGTFQHNGETVGYWLPDTYDETEPTRILVFMRGAGGGLIRPDAFISALETRGVTAILLSNQDSYGTILPDVLVSELAAEGLNVKDEIFLTGFSRGGQMTRRIAPSPSAPTGIEAWRLTHFGTTDNAGEAADTATPAKDGIPNLLKYAFGLDPNKNSSGLYAGQGENGLPSTHQDGNALVLTYRKDTARDDISYTVQTSNDLQSWQTAGITETVIATEGSVEVREASIPIDAAGSPHFLKVEVAR